MEKLHKVVEPIEAEDDPWLCDGGYVCGQAESLPVHGCLEGQRATAAVAG